MEKKSISTLVYIIDGIILGYVSFLLKDEFLALGLTIIFFMLIARALKKALKLKEGFKWFLSHGGWLYFFIWFITWVVFFNL
jgi:hypothetical protein